MVNRKDEEKENKDEVKMVKKSGKLSRKMKKYFKAEEGKMKRI